MFTNNDQLRQIVESFRDWGRDCYCQPGKDNTCGKRFCWKLGDLPYGYDHKYTYSHLGYNLKITDMQAACALAQMDRARRIHRRAQAQLRLPEGGSEDCEEFLHPAGSHTEQRSFLVRLPAHPRAKRGHQPRRPAAISRPEQDRHAPAVRRQPDAPAVHEGAQLPRLRRTDQHRHRS